LSGHPLRNGTFPSFRWDKTSGFDSAQINFAAIPDAPDLKWKDKLDLLNGTRVAA
jgi:hypothetical protein